MSVNVDRCRLIALCATRCSSVRGVRPANREVCGQLRRRQPRRPTVDVVRWDRLFEDLETQAQALDRSVRDGEVAAATRAERSKVTLPDRLRAQLAEVAFRLFDGSVVTGRVRECGHDWVLLDVASGPVLVRLAAVSTVSGLRPGVRVAEGFVARGLGIGHVLRGLARDRVEVGLCLDSAPDVRGTIDSVGADHLDLACHPAGEPRYRAAVTQVLAVPFAAILSLRVH